MSIQLALAQGAPVTCGSFDMDEGNALIVKWGHRLGAMNRPFSQRAYALMLDDRPISIAMSASTVSATVGGYSRKQIVELGRLCSAPGFNWATRVMIRLWREVFARRWPDWEPELAISYQQNAHYTGNIYRFDGWTKVRDDAGKSLGGGTWTRKRASDDPTVGSKSLWLWNY